MKENKKKQINDNIVTGSSSAAGAAAGVVIGSIIMPESVEAQVLPTDEEEDVNIHQNPPIHMPTPQPNPQLDPEPTPQPNPEPNSDPTPQPVIPNPLPLEAEVISYKTVENADGSLIDMAIVNINGAPVAFLDIDRDGKADAMMSDFDMNGTIDDSEIIPLLNSSIEMQPLAAAVGVQPVTPIAPIVDPNGGDPLVANNTDFPDYVNTANVDGYLA